MSDDDKVYTKLKTEVKRGTGTRDQDKTVVTTRHPDPEAAAENHRTAVKNMRRFAGFARSVNPDTDTTLLSGVGKTGSSDADDTDDGVDTSEIPDDLPDPADADEQDMIDAEDTPTDDTDPDDDHLVDLSTDTDDGQATHPDDPPEDLRDTDADVDDELGAFDADGGDDS